MCHFVESGMYHLSCEYFVLLMLLQDMYFLLVSCDLKCAFPLYC